MRPTFFLLIITALTACTVYAPVENTTQSTLQRKSGPYEHLAWIRAWPDTTFDWQGWQRMLQEVRRQPVDLRSADPCAPQPQGQWTLQGPANVAGRVNALALHPQNDDILLAGFSGGGIFKTTDGGVNWKPVFDDQPELSIGDITYDPQNPAVVYAGTGDPNMPFNVFNGRGLYRSTDGGESWHYLALEQQGIVSKVVVDPLNPQTLYVACMGNPYVRDNERGVYKSTDGGLTWSKVLFVSNQAGASDLVINPQNPNILYASFWDRIRSNQESIVYGIHARVYKSTDGGQTWTQLGGGLPTGVMGRTGLAISPQNPDKLYAVYVDSLSRVGGLYRTTDGGTTWTAMNVVALSTAYADFGWYFGKVRINPNNDEEVYIPAVSLWRKDAGSNAWLVGANAHADVHDLVFGSSGRRYLGCDGGVYRNNPGQSWTMCLNLPTTQCYRTDFNPHQPDQYFLGAQDNGIQRGNGQDINNWESLFWADGFRCAFSPISPDTFWVETQNGAIHSTIDGGISWDYGQEALGTSDRVNWDMPFFLSPHNPELLYAATYRAYIGSVSGGWGPISGDLTDGVIYGPRFHTVSCMNESPVLAEKLYAGTSDGNVWRREPAGNFVNITGNLPERYVTSVHGSPTWPNRIFTTHSGYRDNEEIPHIHRTDDNGATWLNITGDLPPAPVNDVFVAPQTNDSVLIAATDAGAFFSTNAGANWKRLGDNMPVIPVFELAFNPVRREVVAATFARGIWTFPLDSLLFPGGNPAPVALAGALQTDGGQPIAAVRVSGTAAPAFTSQADGLYELTSTAPCTEQGIRPSRTDGWLNGVSSYDLVLISRHILGLDTLDTPYRIIAGDANRSGSLTTFDIVVLRKLILGIDTAIVGNTSWRFVPADFVFPNPINPFQTAIPDSIAIDPQGASQPNLDFIGIKIGDLNASAKTDLGPGQPEARDAAPWPVELSDTVMQAGEAVDVVLSGDCTDLEALQFTLDCIGPDVFIESVESLCPYVGEENFYLKESLRICLEPGMWPQRAAGVQPLLRVRVRSAGGGRLAEHLAINALPVAAMAHMTNGEIRRPVIRWKAGAEPVVSVQPNPIGGQGAYLFVRGPVDATFRCTVFDSGGIRHGELQGRVGQPLHLSEVLFGRNGVYYCVVAFADGHEVVEAVAVQNR